MADPRGFLRHVRTGPDRRPVHVRIKDWSEVYLPFPASRLHEQAGRCMDCGIPFCHEGCPLGNLIPEWNDLVWRGLFGEAAERLHATNNFPEITGRLCPAPCEGSCVLGIDQDPVTIKQVELEIAEWSLRDGGRPALVEARTGKSVAIVGSGPAGLAVAQQLARAGHAVVVYERAERAGGLLRYGIPEFKMEKTVLDRRLAQLEAEGVRFRLRTEVTTGPGTVPEVAGAAATDAVRVGARRLLEEHDAVVLAGGSTVPRDLPIRGRELTGVHFAMEYLKPSNLACEGTIEAPSIDAAGKRVVIIGGGDTGADCLGTAHRQGAVEVHQLEIMPSPPATRATANPWPTWPLVLRTSSAHEEGGERRFAVSAGELVGDGKGAVRALRGHEVRPSAGSAGPAGGLEAVKGTDFEIPCELVLLAMGFAGPERNGLVAALDLELDERGNVKRDLSFMTRRAGVFACGDMGRGQSLIVWAIAEGRSAAASVDRFLMGRSDLPSPILPDQLAMR